MSNEVSDEERQLVAAAELAAGTPPDPSPSREWKAFSVGFGRHLYPMIDRGDDLEAVRTTLAAVVDACVRTSSSAALAHERLVFLLGQIRFQEGLRDSDRKPERPKASIEDVIPPTARTAMDVVWAEENQALRDAQYGY